MNPFRRRSRLRYRVSLLAMLALLGSQLAFAAHPGCLAALEALGSSPPPAAATQDCDHSASSTQDIVCQSHCEQGDVSSDVSRVPAVPPLAGPVVLPALVLIAAPEAAQAGWIVDRSPHVHHRRPTLHPAEILLI